MRFHLFIYPFLFLAGTLVFAENELDLSQVAGSGTAEANAGNDCIRSRLEKQRYFWKKRVDAGRAFR